MMKAMRSLIPSVLCTVTACAGLLMATASPLAAAAAAMRFPTRPELEKLQFSDGAFRVDSDLNGNAVMIYHFCGHCPTAAQSITQQVKPLHDRIRSEKLPIRILCITPDIKPSGLAAWQKQKGLEDAWVAYTPENPVQISTSNIWQVQWFDGKLKEPRGRTDEASFIAGAVKSSTYAHPVGAQLKDDRVRGLWWMIERGQTGAGAGLAQGLANASVKAECELLLNDFRARRDALIALSATAANGGIEAYDRLEKLAVVWQGIPAAELAPIKKRMDALAAEKSLADEMAARRAWTTIQGWVAQGGPRNIQQAVAGLDELIKRYPTTKFGKLAAIQKPALAAP